MKPVPKPRRIAGLSLWGLVVCALLGAFAGLSGYTFAEAQGWSYLSNNPKACVNCHVMREQYDGWQKTTHHAVATCNDCHVPQDLVGKYTAKAEHGYRHSKAFTFQDFHEPIRITPADLGIVNDNCRRCHGALVADIVSAQDAHHASMGSAMGGITCTHCHGGIGHGPRR